jgi:hypothetical protein
MPGEKKPHPGPLWYGRLRESCRMNEHMAGLGSRVKSTWRSDASRQIIAESAANRHGASRCASAELNPA